jgi:hypothetical protein
MTAKVIILLILLFQVALKNTMATDKDSGWDIPLLDTASEVNYLSSLEKEIILEINKLRSNPAKYANDYIAPLAKRYKRRLLYYPGDAPLHTREGVAALYECVHDLKQQRPLPLVFPELGLTKAARYHVNDQSKTGHTGHQGSDRSGFRQRIERYGEWKTRIAENIAYGGITAKQIVIYLLIDDGVRNRGHRKNFLNPDFRVIGVATGPHPEYGWMSVMEFAGNFKSN